jgi:hypothetical protein
MTITINASATASIGVISATICQDMNYSLSLATVSNSNGLLWTTSGTGTFSNPATLNPIYTPSTADINSGSVTLTLTAYGDAPCGNATSTMTLNISKAPLAYAGQGTTVCQGTAFTVSGATASNYSSILWTAPGPGTLTNATTLTPTYTPTAGQTGNVLLTLTANPNTGCTTPAVSTMTITINASATATVNGNAPCGSVTSQMTSEYHVPAPIASAGPNSPVLCGAQPFTVLGSSASNSSSLHLDYQWSQGTFVDATVLHPIYTPSAADIAAGSVILDSSGQRQCALYFCNECR